MSVRWPRCRAAFKQELDKILSNELDHQSFFFNLLLFPLGLPSISFHPPALQSYSHGVVSSIWLTEQSHCQSEGALSVRQVNAEGLFAEGLSRLFVPC